MNELRKLASIQKIGAIAPIPNADAIVVAEILGWKVVIKKNEFNIGDRVVYVEIDSVLPDRPEYGFLKDKNNPDKPIRIRTVKLRGQISQGIAFPLTILPPDVQIQVNLGDDVTEILHITKYEPQLPANLRGLAKGIFPSFISKTDEVRIQTLPQLIDKYRNHPIFYVSEKVDGTSATYYWRDGEFGACSRNYELVEDPTNTYWDIALKYSDH